MCGLILLSMTLVNKWRSVSYSNHVTAVPYLLAVFISCPLEQQVEQCCSVRERVKAGF